jgi:hypothetical protein
MSKKILHIAGCDKFIPPFIEFVKEYFDFSAHDFLLMNGMASKELKITPNVHLSKRSILSRLKHYWQAMIKMHQADKVILHGLFDMKLVAMLFFLPWLLKKCYWVMWGGDLYSYQLSERNWKWKRREFFRRSVIRRMGHLVTYIKGDYDLATEWYGARGQYHECFMYPSNLYKDYAIPEVKHSSINILVGNSADPSNNHLEVFDKLEVFKDQDIKIYAPLSYGNQTYAKKVIEEGKKQFGDKFEPLTDMMPFDQYLEFLGLIDVAIFNHKRQQAMGNTITLLSLGKKVFMRSDITPWELFEDIDVKVFDVENIKLDLLDEKIKKDNQEKIKKHFSIDNYKKQLQELFN